jgi:hypothetical protein
MLRQPILAAALVMLSAGFARAQYTGPVGSVNSYGDFGMNLFPDYEQTRPLAEIERDREINQKYRETIARIPDKKPSNDPWKNIRPASTAVVVDRHKPQ